MTQQVNQINEGEVVWHDCAKSEGPKSGWLICKGDMKSATLIAAIGDDRQLDGAVSFDVVLQNQHEILDILKLETNEETIAGWNGLGLSETVTNVRHT